MSGAAELFTVCGSCGQQVSTFVTECPYCGNRLRKRAPKLDRKDGDLEALFAQLDEAAAEPDDVVVPLRVPDTPGGGRRRRWGGERKQSRPARSRPAPRSDEDRRPWATIALVLISLIGLPLTVALGQGNVWLAGGFDSGEPWRLVTSAFTYASTWHALGVLTCLGIFGWLWERRAGALGTAIVVGTFLVAGVAGLALASLADGSGVQAGGVGAAAALATAWIVAELRARQRNDALDGDLLGAAVLLAVALLTSAVTTGGAPLAGVWGLLVGAPLGLALAAARR